MACHYCVRGRGRAAQLCARYGVGCVVGIMEYLFHMMSMSCYVIYVYFRKKYVNSIYILPLLCI